MKKLSGKPHRFEPTDMKWDKEHPKCVQLLKDAGWFNFFEKITGYNVEASKEFAKGFIENRLNFSSINFEVSKHSIAKATRLAIDRDKWFKNFHFEVYLSLLLLSGHETLDWNRGIHRNALKKE